MQNSGASCRESVKSYLPSFRDTHLCVGPESITPVFMFVTKRYHWAYGFRACAKRRIPE
jgi:hypothetical protein